MLKLNRRPSTAKLAAERLHASAVARARLPALYARMGTPDTIEGRFELLSAHIILILDRLGAESGVGAEVRQVLFDTFVSHLDGAMREMGVGDLSMAKRMRRLGEVFYGRLRAYGDALAQLPDETGLAEVIGRTVLAGADVEARPLAGYFAAAHLSLRRQDPEDLIALGPDWGEP